VHIAGKSRKTAFLLGAGASRGAIEHVLHHQKRLKPPLNGDFFKVARTYARAEGKNSVAEDRLDHLLATFKQDLYVKGEPTMEQAFSLLYVAKEFPSIFRTGPGKKPTPGIRKEIDDFLNLLFPILTMLDQRSDGSTGYDRLVRRLTADDTLITLNYDTMLDSALHRRGWDPTKGYAIAGTRKKFRWSPLSLADGQTPLGAKLIKLHGSTNWFVRGSTSNLEKIFSAKPVRITKPRKNEISKHIRQIAPPIYAKIFSHDHWRALWTEAFNALCEADVFVVIGCSLVDTDFHLRALLSQVVRIRKQNGGPFKQVYLVDKLRVRKKWLSVLKGSITRVTHHTTFKGFLQKELTHE
jgi:SIR2-like domain